MDPFIIKLRCQVSSQWIYFIRLLRSNVYIICIYTRNGFRDSLMDLKLHLKYIQGYIGNSINHISYHQIAIKRASYRNLLCNDHFIIKV